jgi:hypothetical protein
VALGAGGTLGGTFVVVLIVADLCAVLVLGNNHLSAAAFVHGTERVFAEIAGFASCAVVVFVAILAQQTTVLILLAGAYM